MFVLCLGLIGESPKLNFKLLKNRCSLPDCLLCLGDPYSKGLTSQDKAMNSKPVLVGLRQGGASMAVSYRI